MQPGLFKSYFGAIAVPILDNGDGRVATVTHDWANSSASLGGGLAVTMLRLNVRNREVAAAKQSLAEMAVNAGCSFIFYIDDDVLVPGDALMKMIQRWRQDPKYKIQNGVYWSKSEPPQPLIFKGSFKGSFWDWKVGDLLEVDGAGAGCTFIDTEVFKNMPKPWFSTNYVYNDPREELDSQRWSMEDELVQLVRIPSPNKNVSDRIEFLKNEISKLSSVMNEMKTTGGIDPGQIRNIDPAGQTTEDLYFYKKAKDILGLSCWVDTSIQCGHQDKTTGRVYSIRDDFPQAKPNVPNPEPGEKLALDIGAGEFGPHWQGYKVTRLDIDPAVKPDIIADARDIPVKDCTFDVVYSAHCLEHFSFKWTKNILKEWIRVLKIGGELILTVPNLEWAAERVLKEKNGIPLNQHEAERAMFMFFSAQKDGGKFDYHKAGFTPKSMKNLLESLGLLTDIKVVTSDGIWTNWDEPGCREGNYNIIAFAKKVKHECPVSIHENLKIMDQEETKFLSIEKEWDNDEKSLEEKQKNIEEKTTSVLGDKKEEDVR